MLNPTYESLEEVERRIKFIKETCGGCHLAIVLNEINLFRLEDLTKLAIKYHSQMRINRLYNGGNIPGYVEEYKNQMSKMFDLLLEAEWAMWPNWIMESTYPTWDGPKNPYSCGKWFAVIDVDGTIRSCNPDYSTVIGHISTSRWDDLKFPQRWSAKNLPECQGCKWVLWCQGGCPYTRKLTWGTYDRKTPFCSAFKELFPKLEMLKNKWLKHQKKI
jgi:radical SAM protein with 4Fe4S-binding SPASM domain